MNQKGFATLEVILMVVVIGILASVAIPRFTDITTKANTAKVQADLSTLDNAIEIYYMDKGEYPTSDAISTLSDYVKDVNKLKPPTGKVFVVGETEAKDISENEYKIDTTEHRATLKIGSDNLTAGSFTTKKTS